MSNEYCVYKITNKLNGKIYIGMSKNLKNRWSANGIHYKQSKRFYNAIQKYGWNNFEKIVLVEGLSFEEACDLEVKNISKYNSRDKKIGYNIAEGGNGGVIYLTHPKGMLGKNQTEYQKTSHKEWASKKENNCMTNGKVVWGDTHKHPQGMKGKKQTEKQKNSARGNKYSCKKVKATLPNSKVIVFDSLNDCCEYFDLSPTSSVTIKLLKTNEPYKLSRNVNNALKEKFKKLVGLKLEYIQKDNSEV